jgi:molybdopterin-dependent oxidoreductase alpha subunit
MGISEKMPDSFLDALGQEFGFDPPRRHGMHAVASIEAMRRGDVRVLVCLGGNLVRAISDSGISEAALRRVHLTVSVATKLNRSHVVTGDVAVILPCLGRTERDPQEGVPQRVTVEDSVGAVHASVGRLRAPSPELRSEVAIVCDLAQRALAPRSTAEAAETGSSASIDWSGLRRDYRLIRDHISHVVPGFESFNERIEEPGGFLLPHPVRDSRTFPTASGRAQFSVNALRPLEVPPGCLVLQTMRSHDQFNTTVYGYEDRYRGIHGSREVVLVNQADLDGLGLAEGDRVDVVTVWDDGIDRRVRGYTLVAYPTTKGCVAAYFPECNVLVPLDSVAEVSNTPTYKSVIVRLEPATTS